MKARLAISVLKATCMEGRAAKSPSSDDQWMRPWAGCCGCGHGIRAGTAIWMASPSSAVAASATTARRKRVSGSHIGTTEPPTNTKGCTKWLDLYGCLRVRMKRFVPDGFPWS